jgi:hypothetical protein
MYGFPPFNTTINNLKTAEHIAQVLYICKFRDCKLYLPVMGPNSLTFRIE